MPRLSKIEDIQNEAVLKIVREGNPEGGTATYTPEEKRAAYRAAAARSGPPEAVAGINEASVNGSIRTRTYMPTTRREGVPNILYLHGGGFLSGDLETHDPVCRLLANHAGAEVTALEYRVAPEHPFPAAIDDCWAVLQTLATRQSRIAVVGDSAGGNLAAVLALKARDADLPLAAQVLIYPMLDALFTSFSLVENALMPPFTLVDCVRAWQYYLPTSKLDRADPHLSPLHAPDLANLPPAMVVTAGFDILRDEGLRYADRLRGAGCAVRHQHFAGMVHGFFQWTGSVAEARLCLHQVVEFLHNV